MCQQLLCQVRPHSLGAYFRETFKLKFVEQTSLHKQSNVNLAKILRHKWQIKKNGNPTKLDVSAQARINN